jgi:hypothetical protein
MDDILLSMTNGRCGYKCRGPSACTPQLSKSAPPALAPAPLSQHTKHKMFSKLFVATVALAGVVSAAPTGGSGSTSGAQCCQWVGNSSQLDAKDAGILAGLLGVVVSGLNVPIGTGCTPISVLGGVSCNTNTVNCGQVFQGELYYGVGLPFDAPD